MKKIKLTQNQYAIVDDENFERLNQYKWHADKHGNTYYAIRKIIIQSQNKEKGIKCKRKRIWMHREIIGRKLKANEEIHHINDNGLDNREENLMVVTRSQHKKISRKRKTKTSSIYKGVYWFKRDKKWKVQITTNGKQIYLGQFHSEVIAAKAYDKAAIKYFGEFARININE